jgi:hypothetical protein
MSTKQLWRLSSFLFIVAAVAGFIGDYGEISTRKGILIGLQCLAAVVTGYLGTSDQG